MKMLGWSLVFGLILAVCMETYYRFREGGYGSDSGGYSAAQDRKFWPGSTLTVTRTINLHDDDGVPVWHVDPGRLVGIGKRSFGRRLVYLLEAPTVRGWVDIEILKASAR